jgi:hypothetical protein
MPTERLAMRHVRDVMRLKSAGMPSREIARRVGAAPSTLRQTIRRFEASGLPWPLPDDVTDAVLEARLFAKAGSGGRRGQRRQAGPDRALVHRELKRKHVTLSIVWEEYIAGEPRRVSLFAVPRVVLRLGRSAAFALAARLSRAMARQGARVWHGVVGHIYIFS